MYFLEPITVSKIWGGKKINELLQNPTDEKIGELFCCSTLSNFTNKLAQTKLTLQDLWLKDNHFFNNHNKGSFPLLIKIIDAQDDLSVQLHPNDEYAQRVENKPFGKNEAWYILETEPNQQIVLGHTANTLEDFKEKVNHKQWSDLLINKTIKPGDIIDLKAGYVHAIKSGTLLYEIQQSSDITYRLYDYDRLENGKHRELHIKKAFDTVLIPQSVEIKSTETHIDKVELIIENKYFKLHKLENAKDNIFNLHMNYAIITCTKGDLLFNMQPIKVGQSVICSHEELKNLSVKGNGQLLIASAN